MFFPLFNVLCVTVLPALSKLHNSQKYFYTIVVVFWFVFFPLKEIPFQKHSCPLRSSPERHCITVRTSMLQKDMKKPQTPNSRFTHGCTYFLYLRSVRHMPVLAFYYKNPHEVCYTYLGVQECVIMFDSIFDLCVDMVTHWPSHMVYFTYVST